MLDCLIWLIKLPFVLLFWLIKVVILSLFWLIKLPFVLLIGLIKLPFVLAFEIGANLLVWTILVGNKPLFTYRTHSTFRHNHSFF